MEIEKQKKEKYTFYPFPMEAKIGEIEVELELTPEEYIKCKKMKKTTFEKFVKENATIRVTDFSVDFDINEIEL